MADVFKKMSEAELIARIKQLHPGCWYNLVYEVGRTSIPASAALPKGGELVITCRALFSHALNYKSHKTTLFAEKVRNATTLEAIKACETEFNSYNAHTKDLIPVGIKKTMTEKLEAAVRGETIAVTAKKRSHLDVLTEGMSEEDAKAFRKAYNAERYPEDMAGLEVIPASEEEKTLKDGTVKIIKTDRKVMFHTYDPRAIHIRTGEWRVPELHYYLVVDDTATEITPDWFKKTYKSSMPRSDEAVEDLSEEQKWFQAARLEIRAKAGRKLYTGPTICKEYNINSILAIEGGKGYGRK